MGPGRRAASKLKIRPADQASCGTFQIKMPPKHCKSSRRAILKRRLRATFSMTLYFLSLRHYSRVVDETMDLAELHENLPSGDRNAVCGEIMYDLVYDIV